MDYSFNSRVRYSETGEDGRLTLPGVLNYFQDCSTFHAESIGLGGNVLKNRDRAWVLSSWQVVVEEYPVLGTEIRIRTAPYAFKGFMGMRNFVMETTDGKKLAWANTNWTYLTISTGIPTRLTPADTDSYVLSEKLEMDYAPRKIKLPEDMISQEAFVVQKHHLDNEPSSEKPSSTFVWQKIFCPQILKYIRCVQNIKCRQSWEMLSVRK